MLTGKRFKLERPTLAVDVINGQRRVVIIPAEAIIRVVSGPNDGDGGDDVVEVLWEGRKVGMFAVDVDLRGTEIQGRSATAVIPKPMYTCPAKKNAGSYKLRPNRRKTGRV